jgi:hypothetical protein
MRGQRVDVYVSIYVYYIYILHTSIYLYGGGGGRERERERDRDRQADRDREKSEKVEKTPQRTKTGTHAHFPLFVLPSLLARDQKPGEVLDPSAVTVSDDLHLDCIDIVKIEEEVCNVEPCQLKPIVAEGSSWFVSFLRFVFYFGVFVVCGLVAAVGWRWHKHKSYRDQYRNVGTSDDTTFEAHHL